MEKAKKTFDAVAMMRKIHDEMSAETDGMDYEEQKRYVSDRLYIAKEWKSIGEQNGRNTDAGSSK